MKEKFEYATEPLPHQATYFEEHRETLYHATLWEQGLGKTKAILDQATWLYCKGLIDGLVVIAPSGVHRNWTSDEVVKHVHPRVKWKACCYQTKTGKTQRAQREMQCLLDHKGFAILVMSYDSLMTETGRDVMKKFLTKRHCFYASDESARIKNPDAKRTKRVLASSAYAPYRRIMSGTPVANGPFDIYSQMKFLNPDFWKPAFPTFAAFKNTFGLFRSQELSNGRRFPMLVQYRQLPYLYSLIKDVSSRLLKKDVLNLPDKIYTKRYFELSAKQQRLYDEIEDTGVFEFGKEDKLVLHDASSALVAQLRKYQVCCGYLPTDPENTRESLTAIDDNNPRLDCLFDTLEDFPGKCLIWCHFTEDVDLIMARAAKEKRTAVRYDGEVSEADRYINLNRFRNSDDCDLFVAKQSVAGEGLTIVEAKTSIYYSNSWFMDKRLQSEDRNHRIGQDVSPTYVDLLSDTELERKIVKALQTKLDVSCAVLGDELVDWIGRSLGIQPQSDNVAHLLQANFDFREYEEFFQPQD